MWVAGLGLEKLNKDSCVFFEKEQGVVLLANLQACEGALQSIPLWCVNRGQVSTPTMPQGNRGRSLVSFLGPCRAVMFYTCYG